MVTNLKPEWTLGLAKYGIDQMEKSEDPISFEFNLTGTLVCLKSTFDHILEDYNREYHLGISLKEPIYSSAFRKRAEAQTNQKALAFIHCYESEKKELLKDEKINRLLARSGLRDYFTHRGIQSVVGHLNRNSSSNRFFLDSDWDQQVEAGKKLEEFESDMASVCEHVLSQLTRFLQKIRTRFGLTSTLDSNELETA